MIEPRLRGREKPQGAVGLRRDAETIAGALPPLLAEADTSSHLKSRASALPPELALTVIAPHVPVTSAEAPLDALSVKLSAATSLALTDEPELASISVSLGDVTVTVTRRLSPQPDFIFFEIYSRSPS